ncbi:iron complex transport system ATP-binding protein [Collimonas sp. PA-H2]|uniref:ATP-binding cassette domain-containing protein n=1 Tax=Collimonas sp. PA-H2 TaxID=1881062 RepID=UPI000BF5FCA4|nr:ATP-binding cassette domain-containing protein [Collimonas sp. PA-H2]PFH11470.1 iron complex transport system ATP-binding protein [Collimonas sp. PA-H2]
MLAAINLSLQRGDKTILRNLNLSIQPGQIVALLGRNGAGKSSLLKAMSGEFHGGLQSGDARLNGQISINHIALDQMNSQQLAQIRAVLPQSVQFSFPFTAMEIALLGRYPHGGSMNDRLIAMEALALAGAAALADRDVTTLSGGELARVQFARVLAQLRPPANGGETPAARYLLLDEPTAALDLAHQHHLLRTLRQLAKEWNIGVLAIMHDPNLAARYADQLAWLADGALLVQDTPALTMTPHIVRTCLGIEVEVVQQAGKPPFAMPA